MSGGAGRSCRIGLAAFALVYAMALGLFVIGFLGRFGQLTDPLAGVFLVPVGWPWNRAVDLAPTAAWPWLAAAAPLVNVAILALVCRRLGGRRERDRV